MALMGSLLDMGVVELVQFPHGGRKTGELMIAGPEQVARLLYREGVLFRAEVGDLEGIDALVELLDWQQGEFEFRHTERLEAPANIEGDLHKTVMVALKLRDERREAMRAQRRDNEEGIDDRLSEKLEGFVRAHEFARYVCVLADDGTVPAEAEASVGRPEQMDEVLAHLHGVLQGHPRGGWQRLMLTDAEGTVVAERVSGDTSLVVAAASEAPLGAVFRALSRFASAEVSP